MNMRETTDRFASASTIAAVAGIVAAVTLAPSAIALDEINAKWSDRVTVENSATGTMKLFGLYLDLDTSLGSTQDCGGTLFSVGGNPDREEQALLGPSSGQPIEFGDWFTFRQQDRNFITQDPDGFGVQCLGGSCTIWSNRANATVRADIDFETAAQTETLLDSFEIENRRWLTTNGSCRESYAIDTESFARMTFEISGEATLSTTAITTTEFPDRCFPEPFVRHLILLGPDVQYFRFPNESSKDLSGSLEIPSGVYDIIDFRVESAVDNINISPSPEPRSIADALDANGDGQLIAQPNAANDADFITDPPPAGLGITLGTSVATLQLTSGGPADDPLTIGIIEGIPWGLLDFDNDGFITADDIDTYDNVITAVTSIPVNLGDRPEFYCSGTGPTDTDLITTCADAPGETAWDAGATYNRQLDADLDGDLDVHDQSVFGELWSTVVPGDADFDGVVGVLDISAVNVAFGTSGLPPYTGGDVTGDGAVNTSDISRVLGNFGTPCP